MLKGCLYFADSLFLFFLPGKTFGGLALLLAVSIGTSGYTAHICQK
jgi:hypothetical protein